MQLRLLDVLADPDKPERWPLQLKVLKSETRTRSVDPIPHKESGLLCRFYCARKSKYLVENPLQEDERVKSKDELEKIVSFDECLTCWKEEIIDGVLYFTLTDSSKRYFIVDREIAVMYPDELRDPKQEKAFFDRYPDIIQELNLSLIK